MCGVVKSITLLIATAVEVGCVTGCGDVPSCCGPQLPCSAAFDGSHEVSRCGNNDGSSNGCRERLGY